jgi:endonuclease YncB( thermonuclease family)
MKARVKQIIDGDTFIIANGWSWSGFSGERVRPTGYDAPEVGTPGATLATWRLSGLILNKDVELRNPVKVDRGRLVVDVYFNGINLAYYFRN